MENPLQPFDGQEQGEMLKHIVGDGKSNAIDSKLQVTKLEKNFAEGGAAGINQRGASRSKESDHGSDARSSLAELTNFRNARTARNGGYVKPTLGKGKISAPQSAKSKGIVSRAGEKAASWLGFGSKKISPTMGTAAVNAAKETSKLRKAASIVTAPVRWGGKVIGGTAKVVGGTVSALGKVGKAGLWLAKSPFALARGALAVGSKLFWPATVGLGIYYGYNAVKEKGLTAGAVTKAALDTIGIVPDSITEKASNVADKISTKASAVYKDLKEGNTTKLTKDVEKGASEVLKVGAKGALVAGEVVKEVAPVALSAVETAGKVALHGTEAIASGIGNAISPTATKYIGWAYNNFKNGVDAIAHSSPVQAIGGAIQEKGRAAASGMHEYLAKTAAPENQVAEEKSKNVVQSAHRFVSRDKYIAPAQQPAAPPQQYDKTA